MTSQDNSLPPDEPRPNHPEPEAERDRTVEPVDAEEPPLLDFPVVGIGASAGGLEAVMEFFAAMPPTSGMAFVVVQHLPPDRDTMIPEILSRKTSMPVSQVAEGAEVKQNHVYVIRPGHTLTLDNGKFRLGESLARPMHNRPIDDFFKSLAAHQRQLAIAIIMSGMGSNGAAGAQAIKAVGGLCIAQDPESARFPSMPRHLIDAGYADYIQRPADMPDEILAYAGHPYAKDRGESPDRVLARERQHIREILAILRTRTRQDFSGYKKPTLVRRIQRRMSLARVTNLADYCRLLRQTPNEVVALADDLLIHVTGFFRDPEVWDSLREHVIVPLIGSRETGSSVRAWVSACSSGEEAYTLAMLLVEEADRIGKALDIKVFATDTAERTLQNARQGAYPGGIEAEISPERLARFFTREDAIYRVRQELRERVVFAPQNVLQDPPFSRLDIINCRNLLIYLEPDLQQRVLHLLHFGLREGGTLVLGTSETVGPLDSMFEPIDKATRIYRRVGPTRHGTVDFTLPRLHGALSSDNPASEVRSAPRLSVGQLTNRALLEFHTPAAVTIDREYRILYYHGRTSPVLSQPSGEPTRDLMVVVRDSVRSLVRTAVHRAMSQGLPAVVEESGVEVEPGQRHHVTVTASPIGSKAEPDLVVVSFQLRAEESASLPPLERSPQHQESTQDLRRVRDELQSTIEELQTSNEELKAAHEEVVSTNEELQSTNEELETSREEMQSLNEELSTVNAQLQAKMEEYQAVTNDLASLLTSTDIAVLFLDTRFRIRRFTPQVKDLLDVIATDIGRPLSDLATKFEDPDLLNHAAAVLERLVPLEHEVAAENDRWFVRRITPYRTAANRIEGVVVTFVEITARRRAEEALRRSEEQFRLAIQGAPIPVIMHTESGEVLQLSDAWTKLTGYALADMPVLDAWLAFVYPDQAAVLRSRLRELFRGDSGEVTLDLTIRTRAGEDRFWSYSASGVGSLSDGSRFVIGMAIDITDRKRAEMELQASKRSIEAGSAMKDRFLANISHELRTPLSVILMWSKMLARTEGGFSPDQLEAIEAISRSAEAQRRLIDDLLDITRIYSGKLRVSPKPMSPAAVIRAAVNAIRPIAESRKLTLELELEERLPEITGDPGRLEQVVWILLNNAVKFTPEGGNIRVHLGMDQGSVAISVTDDGRGIAPEFMPNLFVPFQQAEEGRSKAGLGLGLSIAKSLVELHGGTIAARSDGKDTGATFTVHLPCAAERPYPAQSEIAACSSHPLSGITLLLVEDNPDANRATSVALSTAGAKVVSVFSGLAALDSVSASPPDIIVSDISMPEMDGLEFMRKFRELEASQGRRRIPTIALSAMATRTDIDAAKVSGFDDFIAKPVDPETLINHVAATLNLV